MVEALLNAIAAMDLAILISFILGRYWYPSHLCFHVHLGHRHGFCSMLVKEVSRLPRYSCSSPCYSS